MARIKQCGMLLRSSGSSRAERLFRRREGFPHYMHSRGGHHSRIRQPLSPRRILALSMANILYGVNGEGAGHSTRAREVLSHLVAQGHVGTAVSFDRGLENLK